MKILTRVRNAPIQELVPRARHLADPLNVLIAPTVVVSAGRALGTGPGAGRRREAMMHAPPGMTVDASTSFLPTNGNLAEQEAQGSWAIGETWSGAGPSPADEAKDSSLIAKLAEQRVPRV